ncbi:hypothetical protein GLYMA_17G029400v4 [Glycine max]|nr:uncharacterized protein LOC100801263 isoform X1 [Glycine max]KAG4378383.1 hypothetical protein GLYMA_17G029400v4 [Glycine max]KAH1116476.1 hypothetical protein GYH30_046072 [Glycine max]RZB54917.1 hypothetical protein D0Y65_044715 [Glycine soja]|eukprot:XP_014624854.1 uncharacterized protein LOC100801263 isoform X1 [Glycine max]
MISDDRKKQGHCGHNATKQASCSGKGTFSAVPLTFLFQTLQPDSKLQFLCFLFSSIFPNHIVLLRRFHDCRGSGDGSRSGGDAVPRIPAEEEGRKGVVEVADDVEVEASSGAGEYVRIDCDVIGDVEVHLLGDYWEMANRRLGLRHQLLDAQTGRLQGDLAVASVYGGSSCVELKGPGVVDELQELLRLLTLCMLFSKKPFPEFLDSAGFSLDHVLLHNPEAGLLKPAFTIIHDTQSKCFLLLIRGTHSIKDTLTAATGTVVPFHHSILNDGGISNLVLGYAHCGMVAAARWIAKLCTPTLLKALNKCPDSEVKIVGHSLGGGTAALLTYILREQKELSSSTCVTFAPAACMTWELGESGKHFITTIINGYDLVPTLSASSVDDLRSEVAASSWMSDLWDQAEHTKVLKAVHNSATALGSHLQFISSAKDKVAGVGAILRPVTSGTQVVMKHAQSVVEAVVKTMASHRQNIGPLPKSKLNNLAESSLEPKNISKSLLTESVPVLNKDEPNYSSGRSGLDAIDEEEQLIDANEHITSSVVNDITEGELWYELEKELEKQNNILNIRAQVEEAAAAKEITEEENQLIDAAQGTSNSITASDKVDSYRFYPPGKIMHIVSTPSSDDFSSSSIEEHVKLYETPRQLYSKLRLSRTMINDHYMPTYRKMIQLLIRQLEKDIM